MTRSHHLSTARVAQRISRMGLGGANRSDRGMVQFAGTAGGGDGEGQALARTRREIDSLDIERHTHIARDPWIRAAQHSYRSLILL
jgi:hypothetical protein